MRKDKECSDLSAALLTRKGRRPHGRSTCASLTNGVHSDGALSMKATRWGSAGRRLYVGQDVLARWTDGLLYLGTVTKVDEHNGRCCVKFEDDSEHWTLMKDIQKGASPGEIRCISCQGGKSATPNEIVICDHCGSGYHQICHKPQIKVEVLKPNVKWFCRQCVFTTAAKKGGALKSGVKARAMQVMKQALPYDLSKLTWDCHHKTNCEQCYCYCGGPGDWYLKMLQCCRCLQWFHEACIQCLEKPLVCGDQFFVFACSACNSGPEYIRRLCPTWADVTHLALFNLSIYSHQKYSEFDMAVMPWIHRHWDSLHVTGFETTTWSDRKRRILHALNKHKSRFQNGREIKKSQKLWGLRLRLPPPCPAVVLPAVARLTDDVFSQAQLAAPQSPSPASQAMPSVRPARITSSSSSGKRRRGGKSGLVTSRASLQPPLVPLRYGRVPGGRDTTALPPGAATDSQRYRGYTGDAASYPAVGKRAAAAELRRRDLAVLIPRPLSYEGTDHPFMTPLEQRLVEETRDKRRRLLRRFTLPTASGDDSGDDRAVTPPLSACLPETTGTRKRRGRKCRADMDRATAGGDAGWTDRTRARLPFHVLARRVAPCGGGVQYLLTWAH